MTKDISTGAQKTPPAKPKPGKKGRDGKKKLSFFGRLERSIQKRVTKLARKLAPLEHEEQALKYLREFKPVKSPIVIVSHDGSRTGAPILAYNLTLHLLKNFEVIVLFLGPGPMIEACRDAGAMALGPIPPIGDNADRFAKLLLQHVQPTFAIVNSVESRYLGSALSRSEVCTVSLLHEFAAYIRPLGAFRDVAIYSDAMIFSSTLTRDNMLEYHPELGQMDLIVAPQGRCELPVTKHAPVSSSTVVVEKTIIPSIRPANFPSDGIVVIGLGPVDIRKGVDLFLDCAFRVKKMYSEKPVQFVWVGKWFRPDTDTAYSVYIADQIKRGGLEETVRIVDEMASLEQVYAEADVLLLTSRLDPLPNVAIDALMERIPMICFDQTTGIAEYLTACGLGDSCVAGYLDTADMAEKLLALARSEKLRLEVGNTSAIMATKVFSMPRYVEKVVSAGETQARLRKERAQSATLIAAAGIIRSDFLLVRDDEHLSPSHLAWRYLKDWKLAICPRKPFPGFHPGIYQEMKGLAKSGVDPLADYLSSGRPAGPWQLPVITPTTTTQGNSPQGVALHIHAYYPELLPTIMERMGQNQSPIDLLVSVTSDENREKVLGVLQNYSNGRTDVRVMPNKGRDLGPFLTGFGETIQANYKIIGHFHTKKAPHAQFDLVQQWWNFLLENLLGGKAAMADIILQVMADDEHLGMIYPDDPNPVTWTKNRPHAEALAARLGLPPLPKEISFPVGSMFWARTSSLQALFDLKLAWDDYPAEPVPIDGTMLHAIERLLPDVVRASGHTIALTNVPGVTR